MRFSRLLWMRSRRSRSRQRDCDFETISHPHINNCSYIPRLLSTSCSILQCINYYFKRLTSLELSISRMNIAIPVIHIKNQYKIINLQAECTQRSANIRPEYKMTKTSEVTRGSDIPAPNYPRKLPTTPTFNSLRPRTQLPSSLHNLADIPTPASYSSSINSGQNGPNANLNPPLRRNPAPTPPPRTRGRSLLLLSRLNRRLRITLDAANTPSNRLRPNRPRSLTMPHGYGRSRGGRVHSRPRYRIER